MVIALRLSKAGYGTPDQILKMRADFVVYALVYEGFISDYDRAYYELNKPEN